MKNFHSLLCTLFSKLNSCSALFALITLCLSTFFTASTNAAQTHIKSTNIIGVNAVEIAEVRQINRFRYNHNLPTLRIDATLTRAAKWMALDLGRTARFSHIDSMGRSPFTRLHAFGYPSLDTWRGENLAAGNPSARQTFLQWYHSPPHKANWLNPHFRAIGIARRYVTGSPYRWYWATTFGSRWTKPLS